MQSQGTESTWFYEALAWLELHRKQVISAASGLLVLIVLGYIYSWYQEQHELKASNSLLALKLRSGEEGGPAATPTDLLKVAQQYAGTSAGERALLLAAAELFAAGRYADAQPQFEAFLRQHGGSPLAPTAALGAAACLDAQDKVEPALSAYQGIVNQYGNDPAANRARLALGSLHEARKQPEQALRIYDELSKLPGAGAAVMEATRRKDRLQQQNPGLVLTNAAVLPATPASLPKATAPPATNAPPQP